MLFLFLAPSKLSWSSYSALQKQFTPFAHFMLKPKNLSVVHNKFIRSVQQDALIVMWKEKDTCSKPIKCEKHIVYACPDVDRVMEVKFTQINC